MRGAVWSFSVVVSVVSAGEKDHDPRTTVLWTASQGRSVVSGVSAGEKDHDPRTTMLCTASQGETPPPAGCAQLLPSFNLTWQVAWVRVATRVTGQKQVTLACTHSEMTCHYAGSSSMDVY